MWGQSREKVGATFREDGVVLFMKNESVLSECWDGFGSCLQ